MSIQFLQEQMRKAYQDLEKPFDQPNAEMLRKMALQLAEIIGHIIEYLDNAEKHEKQVDRIIRLERENWKLKRAPRNQIKKRKKKSRGKFPKSKV
jgi:hypothetical protein